MQNIIVKQIETSTILEKSIDIAFINEVLEQGKTLNLFDGFTYKKPTNTEINNYNTQKAQNELQKAKDIKKTFFESEYKQSKIACQITYNGQSYSRSNGFDDMLNLCLQWKSSSQTTIPSLNIPVSLCINVYDALLLMRDSIAKNVEIAKAEIQAKTTLNEVNNYTTELKVKFDSEVKIEDL